MESQPQNPEFRFKPEKFNPCVKLKKLDYIQNENIIGPA